MTTGLLALTGVTSAVLLALRVADPATAHHLLRFVSTNVNALNHHPFVALVASAGWLEDADYPAAAALLIAGVGLLEWRAGSLRAAGTFLVGHVGASLVVAAGLVAGLDAGWFADSVRDAVDVGISYGGYACLAAWPLLGRRPRDRWVLALLAVWLLLRLGMERDFTAAGHIVAALLGAGCGLLLRAERRRPAAEAT